MMKSFKTGKLAVAVLLSIFVFILLLVTAPDIGLTWDEPALRLQNPMLIGLENSLPNHPKH